MRHLQEANVIDWSVLGNIAGADSELRARLLSLFVAESERDLLTIRDAIASREFEVARRAAHQLAGAARTVGAQSLAAAARALELADMDDDDNATMTHLAELSDRLRTVHELIDATPSRASEPSVT